MNFETVVSDVKGRFEVVGAQAQDVAKLGVDTLKASSDVVVSGVQNLVKTNSVVAKDLLESGKASFAKAKTDGFVAVASNPIEYVPAGRDQFVGALNTSVSQVAKTGEELVKILKGGVDKITGSFNGKPVKKAAAKKAPAKRATAKKATAKKAATKKAAA